MIRLFKYNKDTLSYEKITTKQYIKTTASLLGVCVVLFFVGKFTGTNSYITNKIFHKTEVTDTLLVHDEPFSEEALIETIKNTNLKFPYIVLAQAKMESGNYTSQLFHSNHNLLGMRKARRRITTAEKEKNCYAWYRDFKDCIHDYGMWQATIMCDVTTEEQYFQKLGERYAEDVDYVSKLKDLINKQKLKNIFEE